jgi:AraC-like DNA-binding protein
MIRDHARQDAGRDHTSTTLGLLPRRLTTAAAGRQGAYAGRMDVLADVLAATKTGGVVTSYVQAAAPWGFQLNEVPFAAFHAIAEDGCWLRRPGAPPMRLAAGDVVFLPLGSGHALSSHERGPLRNYDQILASIGLTTPGAFVTLAGSGPTIRLICGAYPYDRSVAHPPLAALPPVLHLPHEPAAASHGLGVTLRMLAAELDSQQPGAQTIVDRLVDILFVHIVRAWLSTRTDHPTAWLAALRDPAVAKAIAHLHADPTRQWTVADLAKEVRLSRATLARRFRRLLGQPPLAYLAHWRLQLAAKLVRGRGSGHKEQASPSQPRSTRRTLVRTPTHHRSDRAIGHGERDKIPADLAERLHRAHHQRDLAVRSADLGDLHNGQVLERIGGRVELPVNHIARGDG